jgi:threonine aldolase
MAAMNFSSDNAYGAAPEILEAISAANSGAVSSYGGDPLTAELQTKLSALFECEVQAFPVVTGTAANALGLSTICPQHGAILCSAGAHIAVDECGAPEFFTHGAKVISIEGKNGKIAPAAIETALGQFRKGFVHSPQPAVISITQATELGTVYTPDEIADIAGIARKWGMKLHMDGARFANAIAHLGCTPAEATWKAGVDVLSFGATKNGALCAEAVVFFDRADVRDFEYRRMKGGHLLSKMRFISAQLLSYIENDRWLTFARRANALANRMAQSLATLPGAMLAHPVNANEIFVALPDAVVARLREAGAKFYDWPQAANGHRLIRLVLSFATPESDIENFLAIAQDA